MWSAMSGKVLLPSDEHRDGRKDKDNGNAVAKHGGRSIELSSVSPVEGWLTSGELVTSLGLDFLFYKYVRIHSTVAALSQRYETVVWSFSQCQASHRPSHLEVN